MRHFNALLEESKRLEVFEVIRLMNEFISGKGVTASVQKNNNCFNIYISGYANEDAKKDLSEAGIKSFFSGLGVADELEVVKTQFGYKVVMGPDSQDAKLMESYATESQHLYECCICEEIFVGLGKTPWPVSDDIHERACEYCNTKHVIPMRLEHLRTNKKIEEGSEDERAEVEHEASNTVLDKRYIWVFAVLNSSGEYIDENIIYIQDAISTLLDNDATYLIAFPYVDPRPGDETVGLVFADVPGPITLYNREEATIPKEDLTPSESPDLGGAMKDQAEKEADLDVAQEAIVSDKTSIQIVFNEMTFKEDAPLYAMFDGDFEEYMKGITEASLELAEMGEIVFDWKINENVLESKEIPYEEAKGLINRLRRDFQIAAELKLSNIPESAKETEDWIVIANFKESFYDGLNEDEDVMEVYSAYLKSLKESLTKSEKEVTDFYYEGSTVADYHSNLMSKDQAQKIADCFDKEKVDVMIKKVEV